MSNDTFSLISVLNGSNKHNTLKSGLKTLYTCEQSACSKVTETFLGLKKKLLPNHKPAENNKYTKTDLPEANYKKKNPSHYDGGYFFGGEAVLSLLSVNKSSRC